jgi:hypothetical protein
MGNEQTPSSNGFLDSLTPVSISVTAVLIFLAFACCGIVYWRRRSAQNAKFWFQDRGSFEYVNVAAPPRVSVSEASVVAVPCTYDVKAEQGEVERIRKRVHQQQQARPWTIDDVNEDDIDMSNMPEISAIHYGMSPGETLENDDVDFKPTEFKNHNLSIDDLDTHVFDHVDQVLEST